MKVLVTGGAGFIGSQICERLLDDGHEVVVLDLARTHLPSGAQYIAGDVRDGAAVRSAITAVDAVCHQAAKVGLGTSIADIADYSSHNGFGTAVVLRELAAAGFDGRFVLASSMVVYGEGDYRCAVHGGVRPAARTPEDLDAGRFDPGCPACGAPLVPQAIPESSALDPRNVYAATKLHQEQLSASFSRETGIPVTALRYHNVYGPRLPRDTPYAGVAALFLSEIAGGRAPRVFEDGGQLRDFVHVRDVARANVIALTAPEPRVGAFNVCSGTPRTIAELAAGLVAAAGGGSIAPQLQPVVTGQYRLGDVRHVFASAVHAASVLGFQAREDFAAGLRELHEQTVNSTA